MIQAPESPKDLLIEALEHSDSERRHSRAERIRWAEPYDTPSGLIIGSVEMLSLLREAQACFIEGYYIATLVLATALIEHVISEELVSARFAKYGLSFDRAIKMAREKSLFTDDLLDQADRLRVIRNPFAHRKPDDHVHTLGKRYTTQARHPNLIQEEDAKTAIIAMFGFFKHGMQIK